jgi:hypothetical protein
MLKIHEQISQVFLFKLMMKIRQVFGYNTALLLFFDHIHCGGDASKTGYSLKMGGGAKSGKYSRTGKFLTHITVQSGKNFQWAEKKTMGQDLTEVLIDQMKISMYM